VSFFDILKEKLPQHDLINSGRGGDTVISLYQRIKKLSLSESYDIAFLWVGVNDVFVHVSWKFPIAKLLFNQRWAKNIDDFIKCYQRLLEAITHNAKKTFVVSPSIIGEEIHNTWNKRLGKLSVEIEALAAKYENVEYIDVRKDFILTLSSKKSSPFIPYRIMVDIIIAYLLNDPERVERKSKNRKLYLTLDGVHLNNVGAHIVAKIFLHCIKKCESRILQFKGDMCK